VARVYLFHQRPTGAGARHRPAGARLLPVSLARLRRLEVAHWPGPTLPAYSMERSRLFSALLRQHFFVTVFRACAESLAAENASRLAAMQAAEKNLSERHTALLGAFRRTRQDAITNELLDVVAGYEALQAASPPPDSEMMGTSGSNGTRLAAVTASAGRQLDLMCGRAAPIVPVVKSI
jgi:F-type H+-transporting ATPase subunit gamma